jgi:hypothetical protein
MQTFIVLKEKAICHFFIFVVFVIFEMLLYHNFVHFAFTSEHFQTFSPKMDGRIYPIINIGGNEQFFSLAINSILLILINKQRLFKSGSI